MIHKKSPSVNSKYRWKLRSHSSTWSIPNMFLKTLKTRDERKKVIPPADWFPVYVVLKSNFPWSIRITSTFLFCVSHNLSLFVMVFQPTVLPFSVTFLLLKCQKVLERNIWIFYLMSWFRWKTNHWASSFGTLPLVYVQYYVWILLLGDLLWMSYTFTSVEGSLPDWEFSWM